MTLFDRVFGGNDAVYGLTEGAIDGAIAQYGEDKAVSFPNKHHFANIVEVRKTGQFTDA